MLSKCPEKKRRFQEITCEIRNFSENNYFRKYFFVSNNFVSFAYNRSFLLTIEFILLASGEVGPISTSKDC